MNKKMLSVGMGLVVFLGLVGAWVFLFSGEAQFRGAAYGEPYPPASEIDLARADGSRFRLSELRGQVVLLFFGYTTCPDVCPTTLAEMKLALQGLESAEAARVKVVFVTVDPARDTPQAVQEYVNHFNTDFIGLSGSEVELGAVWSAYGVFREIVEGASASGYLINHTARINMIDQAGSIRVSYAFDAPVDDLVHDLKLLLAEKEN